MAAGATRVVVDCESDADLLDAARAVEALDGPVVTASPGGWLQYHPLAVRADTGFVLVVLGSNTHLNHRELEDLDCVRVGLGRPDWTGVAGETLVVETIGDSSPDDFVRDPELADRAARRGARARAALPRRGGQRRPHGLAARRRAGRAAARR